MFISRSSRLAIVAFKLEGTIPAMVIRGDSIDIVSSVMADMGSTLSWPAWIAERTERRESQLREGAKSRRSVGSL